jgi:hypothetical protein
MAKLESTTVDPKQNCPTLSWGSRSIDVQIQTIFALFWGWCIVGGFCYTTRFFWIWLNVNLDEKLRIRLTAYMRTAVYMQAYMSSCQAAVAIAEVFRGARNASVVLRKGYLRTC